MPLIRAMSPRDKILFPFLETDAVRAACSLLRNKEGKKVSAKVIYKNTAKFIEVTAK